MRFLAAITLALSAISSATAIARPVSNTAPPAIQRSEDVVTAIEHELDTITKDLTSTIDEVVAALGLSPIVDDVDTLLKALVGDVDTLVNEVDSIVDGLLDTLGLGLVVITIDELEEALGLSPTNTIGTLLTDLGIL